MFLSSLNHAKFDPCLLLLFFLLLSDMNEQSQSLLSKMKHLELELAQLKSGWLSLQDVKSCCSTIDALHQKVSSEGNA